MDKAVLHRSVLVNPVLLQGVPHGHDIFWWHVPLDIVDGGEDETSAWRQVVDPPPGIGAHLFWSTFTQYALGIHPTTPKDDILTELAF